MRYYTLPLLAVLAIAANLVVPVQVLKFNACCLNEQGYLKSSVERCCGEPVQGAAFEDPNSCCKPKTFKLRHAPAQPALSEAVSSVPLPVLGVLIAPLKFEAAPRAAAVQATPGFDTGPPAQPSLLSLHSRFNV